jgi:hypothetical protein
MNRLRLEIVLKLVRQRRLRLALVFLALPEGWRVDRHEP